MKNMLRKLWEEDAGIVALEYLLVATIVGLGLVVGLASVFEAMTVELTELSNAILVLDQTYEVAGYTSKNASGADIGVRRGSRGYDLNRTNKVSRQRAEAHSIEVVP